MDSGFGHHFTTNKENIYFPITYPISESSLISNGQSMPIAYSRDTILFATSGLLFKLENLLHMPNLAKSLVSVRKLCVDNHVSIDFYPTHFCVKDLDKRTQLLVEGLENGLYKLL